jgi:hypothetical protein
MRRLGPLSLVALAVLLGGCSSTIDSEKAATTIGRTVAERTGSKIARVSCPSGKTARTGATFTCHVVAADGSAGDVTVVETDDKGTVRVPVPFRNTRQTQIDMAIRLTRQQHTPVGVDCPDLIPIREHVRFDCVAKAGRRRGRLRATQIDAAGKVRYRLVGRL